MTDKMTILVFVGSYLPGFKGGGPIRSVANLVDLLGDEFDFKIITYDHDHGVNEPYAGITPDTWCMVGKAEVYYASNASLRFLALSRLIKSIDHDVLYLNSFFSLEFSIKPLLLRHMRLIPNVGIIVAPRGEFSPGALMLKRLKKRLYLTFVRAFGLYSNILWQASSTFEETDTKNIFKKITSLIANPIIVAPDLVSYQYDNSNNTTIRAKRSEALEVVFVSRISPKKNLDGALSMLKGIQGDITFNIFGPAEDQLYWQKCQNICNTLNTNIRVVFHGEVDHARVHDIFGANHLFFFPTHGENFGHVILEALMAGCPVLLSDQTPWRNLDSLGIGWDLPLDRPDKFRTVLKHCVDMDNDEFTRISRRAEDYGKSSLDDPATLEENRHLFRTAFNHSLLKINQKLHERS